jgi:tetratricopeptide (TPR) repeat protein
MTLNTTGETRAASSLQTRQTLLLLPLILFSFVCIIWLARWMDTHRAPVNSRLEEERLYVSGAAAKRMSLSFNGLIADWYWMRALQYVGHKVIDRAGGVGNVQLDDLSALNLNLLAPLLDATTTLDPQFLPAYEYGAAVLPAINSEDAIALLQKGIAANPSAWRLYQHLGYIYWQQHDYQKAGETYGAGAQLTGAPNWMQALSARMMAEGGSRQTAREMYLRMMNEATDDQVKEIAARRLLQINSFDERDAIRRVLSDYATRMGRCASAWKDVALSLRLARLKLNAAGAPLDPAGTPYLLIKDGCDVDLDSHSRVPYK